MSEGEKTRKVQESAIKRRRAKKEKELRGESNGGKERKGCRRGVATTTERLNDKERKKEVATVPHIKGGNEGKERRGLMQRCCKVHRKT